MTVSGAYGRDYKSAKAMREDWNAGKDFILRSLEGSGYLSKRDCAGQQVMGRYKQDREICVLQDR